MTGMVYRYCGFQAPEKLTSRGSCATERHPAIAGVFSDAGRAGRRPSFAGSQKWCRRMSWTLKAHCFFFKSRPQKPQMDMK